MRFCALTGSVVGTFSIADQPFSGQKPNGHGGTDYAYCSVVMEDFAGRADGFWLFSPEGIPQKDAKVVVFMHGYGAYNPFAYGKWIKHLVGKGNIVIYPRYQWNILVPSASRFPKNAAKAIREALNHLEKTGKISEQPKTIDYIAHSYGGVISANLAVNWEKYHLPKPGSLFLAQPGSGPLKGARLETYAGIPADTKILIVVSEKDYVVGSEFGALVYKTATNTPERNLIVQREDISSEGRRLGAYHSEPYCYDMDFDTGVRNYTAKRVLSVSRVNEVDFNCFWRLSDALREYTHTGIGREAAFGGSIEQLSMGFWEDGNPIRALEAYLPAEKEKTVVSNNY